jgi:hypothetical protein
VGFEPTNPYGIAASGHQIGRRWQFKDRFDWETYEEWLFREYADVTAKDRLCYAKKYADCLVRRDFSTLKLVTASQREHAMKALAVLSKFLGIYEEFRRLVKNYGLKWSSRKSSDLIIDRLTKTIDPNEIFDWVKQVKQAMPQLSDFMDLMATTGLRYSEAIQCYNLIIKSANKGKLEDYYNSEKEILEHFRFKDIFIRRSKKVFISFVSEELVKRISHNKPLERVATQKQVARRVDHLRFGDIREFHGSYITKWLKQVEIDFLHGRTSSSVFMWDYFNPTLIADLRTRTPESATEIGKRIAVGAN